MKFPVIAAILAVVSSLHHPAQANGIKQGTPQPPSPTAGEISAGKDQPGASVIEPLIPQFAEPPADAPAAVPAPADSNAEKEWSAVGEWWVTHPAFKGKLIIREDGSFMRPHGDGGRWMITGDGGRVVLVFRWNNWGTESVAMLGPDVFKGRIRNGAIYLHRLENSKPQAAAEPVKPAALRIVSAMYGIGHQRVDVTDMIRKLVKEGRVELASPWNLGKADPFPGHVKNIVISYQVDGQARTATFAEEENIVLPKE